LKQDQFGWPDGKRIAIHVVAMLEVWSEGKYPQYSVQTTALDPKYVDLGGVAWSRYGGNVGAWRVLKALDHFKLRGTFGTNSMCTEIFPDIVAAIAARGHDICGHAVWQDKMNGYMGIEEERDTILKCLDMFKTATGRRPEGWMSPVMAYTRNTVDLLIDAGVLWWGDVKNVDMPHRIRTTKGKIIGMPTSDFTDNRTLRGSPRHYYEVYKDSFDYLYSHEPCSVLNLAIHCHSGGRPPIIAQFYKLIEYFSKFPDVWFTTAGEIARWIDRQEVDHVTYAKRHLGAASTSRV
jgi:allantoinase